jgi:hypothetical protein
MKQLNTGRFSFDDVEVLDFAGPFGVFSRTRLVSGVESRRSDVSAPFNVITVAPSADPVPATGGFPVLPHFDFAGAPRIDVLVTGRSASHRRGGVRRKHHDRTRTAGGSWFGGYIRNGRGAVSTRGDATAHEASKRLASAGV